MNSTKKHNLTIAFGIFTAMVVVFSQLFFFEVSAVHKKEVKTEKKETKQGDEAYITLPSSSLPSSTSLVTSYDSFCLLEILFESEKETDHVANSSLSPEKLFSTLFRFIISPNAP